MVEQLVISDDKSLLNFDVIFRFLNEEARWSKGIPRETVKRSIKNSLCIGAYLNGDQVGFARMVTDYATFGNLVDVLVLSEYRGNGISRLLLEAMNDHPDLQGLRRIMLATSDKQKLYEKFGYTELGHPEIFMEKYNPNVYS